MWSDEFWLGQAANYSTQSKDPSTKVGCVIVRPNRTLASAGVNGFPRKIADTEERLHNREVKYRIVIHAEMNALHSALEDLTGSTLYCTFAPCAACAPHIIQRGITRVVFPANHENDRWIENQQHSIELFREAGVAVVPVVLQ